MMLTVAVHVMSLLQALQMLDHGSPQNHKRTVTVISPTTEKKHISRNQKVKNGSRNKD
jgi:hypothetical protein